MVQGLGFMKGSEETFCGVLHSLIGFNMASTFGSRLYKSRTEVLKGSIGIYTEQACEKDCMQGWPFWRIRSPITIAAQRVLKTFWGILFQTIVVLPTLETLPCPM